MTTQSEDIRNHEVIVWIAEYLEETFKSDDSPAQGASGLSFDAEGMMTIRGTVDLRLLAQDVLAVAVYLSSVNTEQLQKLMFLLTQQSEGGNE